MTKQQINSLIDNCDIKSIIENVPNGDIIVERIAHQLSKDSIKICQEFIDIYTDPSNYKDSWYFDAKIDGFKQILRAFESRYRNENIVIEIEDKTY